MTTDLKAEIAKLEAARCEALMQADYAGLAALMSPDLSYIHSNGHVDGKDEMLARMEKNFEFLEVSRGPLTIRGYGAAALTIGTMHQRLRWKDTGEVKEIDSTCTQLWADHDGTVQMVLLQAAVTAAVVVEAGQ